MRKSVFAVTKNLYSSEEIKQLNEEINKKNKKKRCVKPSKLENGTKNFN